MIVISFQDRMMSCIFWRVFLHNSYKAMTAKPISLTLGNFNFKRKGNKKRNRKETKKKKKEYQSRSMNRSGTRQKGKF